MFLLNSCKMRKIRTGEDSFFFFFFLGLILVELLLKLSIMCTEVQAYAVTAELRVAINGNFISNNVPIYNRCEKNLNGY